MIWSTQWRRLVREQRCSWELNQRGSWCWKAPLSAPRELWSLSTKWPDLESPMEVSSPRHTFVLVLEHIFIHFETTVDSDWDWVEASTVETLSEDIASCHILGRTNSHTENKVMLPMTHCILCFSLFPFLVDLYPPYSIQPYSTLSFWTILPCKNTFHRIEVTSLLPELHQLAAPPLLLKILTFPHLYNGCGRELLRNRMNLTFHPSEGGGPFLGLFVIIFSPHYVFWLIPLWFHGLPMYDWLQTSYENSGRFVWRLPKKMDRIVSENMLLDYTQVFMMVIIPNVCWESRCTRHLRHRREKASLAAMRNPCYHREQTQSCTVLQSQRQSLRESSYSQA